MSKITKAKIEIEKAYHSNGGVSLERYFNEDGLYHRLDGPAFIEYYEDGGVHTESWSRNDKGHREDGPAWISYEEDGSIDRIMFYLKDREIGFWDFYDKVSSEIQKTLLRDWLPYV
jgi:antitoxin component YwqK of YwqJK toxin-antitoxin module